MVTGWRYRVLSATGAAVWTVIALSIANHPLSQALFTTYVPVFWRLDPLTVSGDRLQLITAVSVGAVVVSLSPLYKPQPRRTIDTITLVQKRVLVAGLALATLGFYEWSHRLPRATLTMVIGLLVVVLPMWFVWIRRRPAGTPERAVVVGDDIDQIERIVGETDVQLIGYLCPTSVLPTDTTDRPLATIADGGRPIGGLDRLGGFSRLESILLTHDVDTVVLAFQQADREEFFGALDTCHEHGIAIKVHREYADDVLIDETSAGPLVDAKVEPWDLQDYILKRLFDIGFAVVGLAVATPVMVCTALAITLERTGPVMYAQRRTAGLGGEITVYKFRTMLPGSATADPTPPPERITRLGHVLRRTHIDELPQLWLILTGKMSVVGPRPVWTDEEPLLEAETDAWRKRWFVKPGLTGLAQIRRAGSEDPELKLRSDLEYIRRQSFSLDLYIVVMQLWLVVLDVVSGIESGQ